MIPDNYIAEVRLADGDLDGAMESAEEALRLSREFGTRAWEPHALLFTGRIIGGKDPSQVEVAEQYIRQSILLAEEMHSPPFLAKAYLFLGEVFEKAGRRKEAQENMREAIEMWEEMGVNPQSYWLTRTQEALARLSQ
jgi:tetratricopeptide (TPR) repeat protein